MHIQSVTTCFLVSLTCQKIILWLLALVIQVTIKRLQGEKNVMDRMPCDNVNIGEFVLTQHCSLDFEFCLNVFLSFHFPEVWSMRRFSALGNGWITWHLITSD